MYTTYGVGKEMGYAYDGAFGAILGVGDAVGKYHLGKAGVVDALGGGVAHDGVAGKGAYRFGTCFEHDVGSFGDGAGRIYHVVNQYHVLVFNIADTVIDSTTLALARCLWQRTRGTLRYLA